MSNNSIDGFLFFTSGSLHTNHNIIEICNIKNERDYETITELLKSAF
jgi:hypothetical protein